MGCQREGGYIGKKRVCEGGNRRAYGGVSSEGISADGYRKRIRIKI